ncbi:SH3 domain-containing protein [Streptomyces carminius]|uniref:SH3 domain-containing protein n=1 Tax=Streptomyces carminius TaxID=2665496 RepID=A0A2M8LVY1_9ACTN|nr:SH3 domain-containing protein [Streptomyces carminius]PJE96096.1 SH3 domain-containing protein [Streptomyces carminius]
MIKSKLSKLTLCAVGGAVALATAAGPALAEPTPAEELSRPSVEAPMQMAEEAAPSTLTAASSYKGRVIARSGLNVRSKPNTHSKVIGSLPYGKVIHIDCKVNSQNIDGNPRWYKLDRKHHHHDGWVSARYVVNIGAAPHYCHHR